MKQKVSELINNLYKGRYDSIEVYCGTQLNLEYCKFVDEAEKGQEDSLDRYLGMDADDYDLMDHEDYCNFDYTAIDMEEYKDKKILCILLSESEIRKEPCGKYRFDSFNFYKDEVETLRKVNKGEATLHLALELGEEHNLYFDVDGLDVILWEQNPCRFYHLITEGNVIVAINEVEEITE